MKLERGSGTRSSRVVSCGSSSYNSHHGPDLSGSIYSPAMSRAYESRRVRKPFSTIIYHPRSSAYTVLPLTHFSPGCPREIRLFCIETNRTDIVRILFWGARRSDRTVKVMTARREISYFSPWVCLHIYCTVLLRASPRVPSAC